VKRWVRSIAKKIAATSHHRLHLHGAVLERGGVIIAVGINQDEVKSPKHSHFSTHAEVAAIIKAGEAARGATLYVARVKKSKAAMSKPCPNCQLAIKIAGIRKVFYSIDGDNWERM
jgi:tRNA(Arg) A34 adenosine deaminase TadA